MKKATRITRIFLDIGGVLLTDGWDHLARRRTAKNFKLEWAEMALREGSGAVSVLVTADILGFTREAGAEVAESCRQKFGISRDRLILNASHTHSAPVIDPPTWPEHELMPASQFPVVKRYTATLVDKTVEAVGAALHCMAPARLRFGQGFAGIGVNRRRAVMGRNLPGQVDQDVQIGRAHV